MKINAKLSPYWKKFIRDLLVIIIVTTAFRSAVADWNDVPTGSMEPTILPGDRIYINKIAYDLKVPFTTWHIAEWSNPERGDIVVLYSPADGKRLVKRVIGLPGDIVSMKNNILTINGEPLEYKSDNQKIFPDRISQTKVISETLGDIDHPITINPSNLTKRSFGPMKIPDDQYFVMGDNRDYSFDSRFFGCVDRDQIIGHSTAVVFSFDLDKYYMPRWSRFFEGIQ